MEALTAGREALERADWEEARRRFEEAVRLTDAPEAWEGLSRAAWWIGDQETTLDARERAYRGYRDREDDCPAAYMAMWVASDHLDFRGDEALARAWLQRGRDLLADGRPCRELAYVTVLEADIEFLSGGDLHKAEELARTALELARGVGDAGVEAVSLVVLGATLVSMGDVDEGLACIERGAALAVSESFDEHAAAGWALCHTVSACAGLGDFQRAEQWCRALHTWSANWQGRHFFGVCRTAYGEVLATSGDWLDAEQELMSAMQDLQATRPALAASTAVRLGRLRARQGKPAEARVLFESALPLPDAIVGLGELDLRAGDPMAAADAAERALRRLSEASVLDRVPALELLARAHAAAGDHEAATEAAHACEAIADQLATPYMRGRGRLVCADAMNALGDHEGARRAAEDAIDHFSAGSAPYEAAQARTVLAQALERLGRGERAEQEAAAAREALALLGAREPAREAGELSPRERDILRLVAQGRSDAEIAGRLFLSPHTVHRHMANIRTKLRVPSRAAAVSEATRAGLL